MLELFKGKKVTVLVAFSSFTPGGSIPSKHKGVITDCNDEAIILDNKVYISRKYIISVQ